MYYFQDTLLVLLLASILTLLVSTILTAAFLRLANGGNIWGAAGEAWGFLFYRRYGRIFLLSGLTLVCAWWGFSGPLPVSRALEDLRGFNMNSETSDWGQVGSIVAFALSLLALVIYVNASASKTTSAGNGNHH